MVSSQSTNYRPLDKEMHHMIDALNYIVIYKWNITPILP